MKTITPMKSFFKKLKTSQTQSHERELYKPYGGKLELEDGVVVFYYQYEDAHENIDGSFDVIVNGFVGKDENKIKFGGMLKRTTAENFKDVSKILPSSLSFSIEEAFKKLKLKSSPQEYIETIVKNVPFHAVKEYSKNPRAYIKQNNKKPVKENDKENKKEEKKPNGQNTDNKFKKNDIVEIKINKLKDGGKFNTYYEIYPEIEENNLAVFKNYLDKKNENGDAKIVLKNGKIIENNTNYISYHGKIKNEDDVKQNAYKHYLALKEQGTQIDKETYIFIIHYKISKKMPLDEAETRVAKILKIKVPNFEKKDTNQNNTSENYNTEQELSSGSVDGEQKPLELGAKLNKLKTYFSKLKNK